MDGLPTWVRWITVVIVGFSPILTFWMANVLGRYIAVQAMGAAATEPPPATG